MTDPAPFVVAIGGANIDIHGRSANRLRRRDSNPGTVRLSAGGVARNIAENLSRLGVAGRLIAAIGTDEHGQLLKRLCNDAGIDMRFVHEIGSAQTSSYLSVLDVDGDMQLAVADMEIVDQLGAARLEPQRQMLQQAAVIVVDANLTPAAIAWLASNRGGVPIFADAVSTRKAIRLQPHLAAIHTLKAGSDEAEAITEMPAETESQLTELAADLHARGVQRVFITCGADGVYFSSGDECGMLSDHRKPAAVQNAGGAGDAFLAGLVFAWLQKLSLQESLRFALAVAEITLDSPETCSPHLSVQAVHAALKIEKRKQEQ